LFLFFVQIGPTGTEQIHTIIFVPDLFEQKLVEQIYGSSTSAPRRVLPPRAAAGGEGAGGGGGGSGSGGTGAAAAAAAAHSGSGNVPRVRFNIPTRPSREAPHSPLPLRYRSSSWRRRMSREREIT